MSRVLSDTTIAELLSERKVLPSGFRAALALKAVNRNERADLEIVGDAGGRFRLMLRRAELNQFDFSVIPGYQFLTPTH